MNQDKTNGHNQSVNVDALLDEVTAHIQQGDLTRAKLSLRGALQTHTMHALGELAQELHQKGDSSAAELLLDNMRGIYQEMRHNVAQQLSPEMLEVMRRTEELHEQASYSNPESVYRDVLAVHETILGKEHPLTKITRENLAQVYEQMGEADKAATVRAGELP